MKFIPHRAKCVRPQGHEFGSIWNGIKYVLLLLSALLILTACGKPPAENSGKIKIAVTLFPYYDFVRQIAGDSVEIKLIIPAGMDSHSFEPTPADMKVLGDADIIIWNGGEMEHWMEQVLDTFDMSETTVLTMMDYVDVVETETVEGMEEGHKEAHHHHGDEEEYDEHIWTSPVNAAKLADVIGQALIDAVPRRETEYRAQTDAYIGELKALDSEFRRLAMEKERNVIVVGDKFPFRYLADEYGFEYLAAFSGCSSDTEPSAKTIAFLIDKISEEKIPVVYYLEMGSHRISQVIRDETGAEPLLLHSCNNVTPAEFESGATYLTLMEQNVMNLRKGLAE